MTYRQDIRRQNPGPWLSSKVFNNGTKNEIGQRNTISSMVKKRWIVSILTELWIHEQNSKTNKSLEKHARFGNSTRLTLVFFRPAGNFVTEHSWSTRHIEWTVALKRQIYSFECCSQLNELSVEIMWKSGDFILFGVNK